MFVDFCVCTSGVQLFGTILVYVYLELVLVCVYYLVSYLFCALATITLCSSRCVHTYLHYRLNIGGVIYGAALCSSSTINKSFLFLATFQAISFLKLI